MRRAVRASLLLAAGAVLASGCAREAERDGEEEPIAAPSAAEPPAQGQAAPPAAAPDPQAPHQCRVIIAASGRTAETITGQATSPSEVEATEQAYREACRQLSPTERPACRDKTRWHPSITVKPAAGGGRVEVSVALSPADPPQVIGEASSSESEDRACHDATLDACQKAGAEGDCVEAGAFEVLGKSTADPPR